MVLFLVSLSCDNNPLAKEIEIWPEIEPYDTGFLDVSDLHKIYYEQSGNPNGKPVFMVHGGPGVGCKPVMRRFFNPEVFRIILFDQRGAGRSLPYAEIKENTTQDLIKDIEKLRNHLGLEKIFLFGGSWGSTLSLAYAETYPNNVSGMILRGIWTSTQKEIDNFYHGGAAYHFPEAYQRLLESLPDSTIRPLPNYLVQLMQGSDTLLREKIAKEWARYEIKMVDINITDEIIDSRVENDNMLAFSLLENYYMSNNCFLEEDELIINAENIKDIPCTIINGRYDMCCPPITAYRLHQALPKSKLIIDEFGGHGSWSVIKITIQEMRKFE